MALQTITAMLAIGLFVLFGVVFWSKENYPGNKHDQFNFNVHKSAQGLVCILQRILVLKFVVQGA